MFLLQLQDTLPSHSYTTVVCYLTHGQLIISPRAGI
jgi:hypothetical protein